MLYLLLEQIDRHRRVVHDILSDHKNGELIIWISGYGNCRKSAYGITLDIRSGSRSCADLVRIWNRDANRVVKPIICGVLVPQGDRDVGCRRLRGIIAGRVSRVRQREGSAD